MLFFLKGKNQRLCWKNIIYSRKYTLLTYRHRSLAVLCELMHLDKSNMCGSASVYEYDFFLSELSR